MLLSFAQLIEGISTIPIALYGIRSYALHLPLAVVMAETLSADDIRRYGRCLLLLCIPMTILIVAQFAAPSDSWLNAGAGDGGGQILSARGHVRPAATFSYGVGAQCLVVLTAAFVMDAWMASDKYRAWLLWPATLATVASIPLLGSRTVVFTIATMVSLTLLSGVSNAGRLAGLGKVVAILILAGAVSFQLPFFKDGIETFQQRWQQASDDEGGIRDVFGKRVLGVFLSGVDSAGNTGWLGHGVGMGSNFAAVLTTGSSTFLMAEMEWERVVLEFGPVCGLAFLGLRVVFAIYLCLSACRVLGRKSPLALLLIPAVVPLVVMTTMEQPSYLGFMTIGAGLCLSAARQKSVNQFGTSQSQLALYK